MFIEDASRIGLKEKEPVTVSSVGVLVHVGDLSPKGNPSFLLVERVDHPEEIGWSIPAGRTEDFDRTPKKSAIRELREESLLIAKLANLIPFVAVEKINDESKIRFVYSYKCNLEELTSLKKFNKREGILITSSKDPVSSEIRRLAIIPRFKLFERSSNLIDNYIKWEVMHWIKSRLEGLRVI